MNIQERIAKEFADVFSEMIADIIGEEVADEVAEDTVECCCECCENCEEAVLEELVRQLADEDELDDVSLIRVINDDAFDEEEEDYREISIMYLEDEDGAAKPGLVKVEVDADIEGNGPVLSSLLYAAAELIWDELGGKNEILTREDIYDAIVESVAEATINLSKVVLRKSMQLVKEGKIRVTVDGE